MDWWRLFGGTFLLIFLAELGDKTQLAAMARAGSSGSAARWVVFFGASAALVASTFIAVFLGDFFKSLIPDERYIKIASGILFLVFGLAMLSGVYASYRDGGKGPAADAAASEAAEEPPRPGKSADG